MAFSEQMGDGNSPPTSTWEWDIPILCQARDGIFPYMAFGGWDNPILEMGRDGDKDIRFSGNGIIPSRIPYHGIFSGIPIKIPENFSAHNRLLIATQFASFFKKSQ